MYFVPAFSGLGAPHWEPEARGTLVGVTRGTSRAHLVRSALESMAYATAEVLSTMEVDSGIEMTELRVDGGAAINDWLMTFQAGLVRVPVQRPPLVEMTALGAAGLAGLSQGVWATAEDFRLSQGKPDQFDSIMPEAEAFRLKQGLARAVRAATHWARDSSE